VLDMRHPVRHTHQHSASAVACPSDSRARWDVRKADLGSRPRRL
jgi:hypothetical protein